MRAVEILPWSQMLSEPITDYSSLPGYVPGHNEIVYDYNPDLNKRIAIWNGDITMLQIDAITNTTNESLNDSNSISDKIFKGAGPGLKEEIILEGKVCRTGEVCVTSGYDLPTRYIIHTVGPKYTSKYHTAAENALITCYRNVLYKSKELGNKSLALCLVNTIKKNFPPDLAVHIALRTLREYLENERQPHYVIMCSNGESSLLESLAGMYFPRSQLEANAARYTLPSISTTLSDRRIRIIRNPHDPLNGVDDATSISEEEWYGSDNAVAAVAALSRNTDTQLLLPTSSPTSPISFHLNVDEQLRYERLLQRAKEEDLSEVSGIGCLYQCGVDRLGRPVVVFIGKWFPVNEINLDKALLYLIYLLDPIVRGDYVIVYFHTLTASSNYPPFSWLKECYTILPYKYKKNLKAFYIVHPTFWTKMVTWWFTTFMAPAIKHKVHNLPGIEYLYAVMTRDQLEIPAFITEYDMTINGLNYFEPDDGVTLS